MKDNSLKLPWVYPFIAGVLFLVSSCASFKEQSLRTASADSTSNSSSNYEIFLAGGFGSGSLQDTLALHQLRKQLLSASANSTLIFTGDNVPAVKNKQTFDEAYLKRQLDILKDYKGSVIFLPGSNEWASWDTRLVELTEKYLKDKDLQHVKVLPENACPVEQVIISEELDLILIDSRWFTADWNRVDNINRKCTDILTRRRFAEELEGYINDAQDKNLVIAMHHPVFSNGSYAGNHTLKQHLLPLPGVASLYRKIEELAAFSPNNLGNRRYKYFRILLSALAQKSDRITFLSGHEESLQYLKSKNLHQVISGSLNTIAPTYRSKDEIVAVGGGLRYEGIYTNPAKGFAKLTYFDDGASKVTFHINEGITKSFDILPPFGKKEQRQTNYAELPSTYKTSIFQDSTKLKKSGFYKFWWGERFRSYYGKKVTAPVADLDSLFGGLKIAKEGGGHQSQTLRLITDDGKEYAMRSLQKNALKFLKFKVKGIAYSEDDYKGTWIQKVVSDFFTTSHPYMQLVIDPLAEKAAVNHAETQLFYVPKQKALGAYAEEYGDDLYFIEQRPSDEQYRFDGYRRTLPAVPGKIPDFESTTDMLEKIKGDESYMIDQKSFIRARIFDMLIGDWDRHEDQWRWAEYNVKDSSKKIFMPIPRDRDAAFSRFDGTAIPLIQLFVPDTRFWQSYRKEIKDTKWFNAEGNNLDRALLNQYGVDVWIEEAKFIQDHITDKDIEQAFERLPKEVQDSTASRFKTVLKARLKDLPSYARSYGSYLNEVVSIHATEKDDKIIIERLNNGKTRITLRRIFSDEPNEIFYERSFDENETREIWVFGLGDNDIFEVTGTERSNTMIRLIGGYGEDVFNIKNDRKVKVYDWSHEAITFEDQKPRKSLTNTYRANTFHWRYFRENHHIILPNIGFRTDDGLFLGGRYSYTNNGFNSDPFRYKHAISANYYFNFQGVELSYLGQWANVIPSWNFQVEGYFTNDKFINNFFGFGNETLNFDEALGREFNRARMEQFRLKAGIVFKTLQIKAAFENIKIENTPGRFFVPSNIDANAFDNQTYVGLETSLYYKNNDADDFPTKGIYFGFAGGFKANTQISENKFAHMAFTVGFNHKLIKSGDLVLGTTAKYKTLIGDDYFFYHAPSIGGDNGLRGYRNERFSGDSYFFQSSDLRLRLKRYITPAVPITFGIYGGFDYGRVWLDGESSNTWHTSQGGGLWVSALKKLAFNIGFFNSSEDNMLTVGFGFDF
ncbi:hypothetical protein ACFQ1M_00200 [Sungkyunkwania multivorans]|uniref:Haemolysin activator HlyB C-terminal domain-containing protein n=1 Tax=Sungkyunkwania multivorans TaxID=1173618 RepID=A0ABW3CVA9_9FLAO